MKLFIICRCTKYAKEFMEINNLDEGNCIISKTWGKSLSGNPGDGYVIIRPYPPGSIIQWKLKLDKIGLINRTRNYIIS